LSHSSVEPWLTHAHKRRHCLCVEGGQNAYTPHHHQQASMQRHTWQVPVRRCKNRTCDTTQELYVKNYMWLRHKNYMWLRHKNYMWLRHKNYMWLPLWPQPPRSARRATESAGTRSGANAERSGANERRNAPRLARGRSRQSESDRGEGACDEERAIEGKQTRTNLCLSAPW